MPRIKSVKELDKIIFDRIDQQDFNPEKVADTTLQRIRRIAGKHKNDNKQSFTR